MHLAGLLPVYYSRKIMSFNHHLPRMIIIMLFLKLVLGNDFVPKEKTIPVKQNEKATIEWQCNFPLPTGDVFVHVYFQPPNRPRENNILAFISKRIPNIGSNNLHFKDKIQVTTEDNGGTFKFFIDITNTDITEEGKYIIIRSSVDGSVTSSEGFVTVQVIVPPNIQKKPATMEKNEREDVSLPCIVIAGNPKPLTFVWYFQREGSNDKTAVTAEVKKYERFDFNISNVDHRSVGVYECVVTNGYNDRDSFKINLRVRHTPHVFIPPINTTVFEGNGVVTMHCVARGNPTTASYIWYQGPDRVLINQETDTIKIEDNGSRLRFFNPSRSLSTKYWCAGRNELGTGVPKGAYLNVTYIPEPIQIPTAVNDVVNGNKGSNITVKCVSQANPPATYKWTKLVEFNGLTKEENIGEESRMGELTLYSAFINDTGKYKCSAFNFPNPNKPKEKYGAYKTITIKVNYGPLRTNITVNGFNQSNKEIQIPLNNPVEIKCESHSEPPALYNIKYGNSQMNSDVNIGLYRIGALTMSEEGDYTCIAINPVLRTTENRTIKVLVAIKPTIVMPVPLSERTVNERGTVRITCHAKGRPAPKVFWTKDDKNITSFSDGVITRSYIEVPAKPGDIQVKIEASLIFTKIRSTDEGRYKCIVYNGGGRVDAAVKFTVNYAPKFLQPLKNYTVQEEKNSVTFFCAVEGKPNNNIQYRWFFNGGQISNTDSKLLIGVPKRDDNGNYQCEASNVIGSRRSTIGILVVTYPPKIYYLTSDILTDVKASFILQCKAKGVPPPVFEWSNDLDVNFKFIGDTYHVKDVKPSDKGKYTCTVKNNEGSDSMQVKVLVRHKPIIESTSPSQTKIGASLKENVDLVCEAEGYPIPDIQWNEYTSPNSLGNDYNIDSNKMEFGIKSTLSFTVQESHFSTKFVCKASNNRGNDQVIFQVLKKGKPDPPIAITATDKLSPDPAITVNITLKWVPGFNGGHPVTFTLFYKESNHENFLEMYIGAVDRNTFVFQNRKPGTTYEFALVAKNKLGISARSNIFRFTTKAAPKPVASFELRRRDDTSVIVSWVINESPIAEASRKRRSTKLTWDYGLIKYRIVGSDVWLQEKISNIPQNGTYVVKDLNPSGTYEFNLFLYDTDGGFGTTISSKSQITPGTPIKSTSSHTLSKTDIVAIAVGCGGTILIIIIIILFIAIHKRSKGQKSKNNSAYNPRVRVDIPVSTIKSGYSDVVRTSYMNDDEDPFAMDSTIIDENNDKSPPPPEYNSVHYFADAQRTRDYHEPENPTPSYTSFGRLAKKSGDDRPDNKSHSKSMMSLSGTRSSEISRGNERNRYSVDNLDEYPLKDASDPLIQKSKNDRNSKNKRNSRGRLSSDEDLPEPPSFMKDALRSPPSDEGHLNRAPGAFGDRNGQRYKKPQPKIYEEAVPPPPPNGIHQNTRAGSPTPSSIASSKPYRSDNEYIDDQDDKYVGYLV